MNPAHHLERSQLYLGFVSDDLRAGDFSRAARAVERAASHAATAAAVHWHHRHYSWRRLTSAVASLVHAGRVEYRHLRTLREVTRLTVTLSEPGNDPNAVRALLRRLHRRVARLRQAVARAIAHDPNPVNIADLLPRVASGNQYYRPESASPAPGIQPQSLVPHRPTSQTALAPATPHNQIVIPTIKSSFLQSNRHSCNQFVIPAKAGIHCRYWKRNRQILSIHVRLPPPHHKPRTREKPHPRQPSALPKSS